MLRIGKRREEYFAVAQAALLAAKQRQSRRKTAICLGHGEMSGLSARTEAIQTGLWEVGFSSATAN
jgi:hypothetical protein